MRTAIQKCPISVFENAHAKYQCFFFNRQLFGEHG